MKWRSRPEPREGERRIRRCFAWFPVRLDNGDVVLWESYQVEECFGEYPPGTSQYGVTTYGVRIIPPYWVTIRRFQAGEAPC